MREENNKQKTEKGNKGEKNAENQRKIPNSLSLIFLDMRWYCIQKARLGCHKKRKNEIEFSKIKTVNWNKSFKRIRR